jgi:RimJ/RimL family protein N-acetyltransferase
LYKFYAGSPPTTVEELERRYEGWATRKSPDGTQTWLNYAVRRKHGAYVGWIQASIAGPVATIGYDIFPEFWRQRFATEACGELIRVLREQHGIATVAAVVDEENIASIRLVEALGFRLVWTGPSEDMPGRQDRRYEIDVRRGA